MGRLRAEARHACATSVVRGPVDRRAPKPIVTAPGITESLLSRPRVGRIQKSAEAIATDHVSGAVHVGIPLDQRAVDPLLVPLGMIVLREFSDRSSKASRATGPDSVQALGPGGQHEPFREGSQVRTPRRQPPTLHPAQLLDLRKPSVCRGSRSATTCRLPSVASRLRSASVSRIRLVPSLSRRSRFPALK